VIAVIVELLASALLLSDGGQTRYAIVRDPDAPNAVRFAAHDLAKTLKAVTGAEFPVVAPSHAAAYGRRTIEVGTARGLRLAGDKRLAALGKDGSCSFSTNETVVLVGRDLFGVTGAVYDFLERQVGCRWFTPWGDERLPKRGHLELKPFSRDVTPSFGARYLMDFSQLARYCRNGELFAFRNGLNVTGIAVYGNIDMPKECTALLSETYPIGQYSHTIFNYIPPHANNRYKLPGIPEEGYFKSHPEWFSLQKSGKISKRVDNRHLCFSNRDLRTTLISNFIAHVEKTGARAFSGEGGLYSISVNDLPGRLCDCDDCRALEEKYATAGAPLFLCLKEAAEELYRRYPDAKVGTLAYRRGQTQTPPNDAFPRFPPNVMITFAPIDDDFSKNLNHPFNAVTVRDLRRWSGLVKEVWSWYYPISYCSPSPYAGVRRTVEDMRIMRDNGLYAFGCEHDVGRDCGMSFYDMYSYVMAKAARDLSLDANALAREFCEGYYGAAAVDMYAYWDELESIREKTREKVVWCGRVNDYFTPEKLLRWNRLFDGMELKVAEDADTLQRVREVRLGLDSAVLAQYPNITRFDRSFAVKPETIRDRATNTLCRAFTRRGRPQYFTPIRREVAKFNERCLLAGLSGLKPKEFAHIPDEDVRQSLTVDVTCGMRRRPMADSVTGSAAWCEKEIASGRKDITFWIIDWPERKKMAEGVIRNKDMLEGRFHLYKLARVRLTRETVVAPGYSYYVKFRLDDLYEPGSDDEWDVYVSAKFEGPKYFPGSKKANMAAFDRTVIVRVPKTTK
jgi:hypothetical protein